jgi:hypothetical protein
MGSIIESAFKILEKLFPYRSLRSKIYQSFWSMGERRFDFAQRGTPPTD